VPKYEFVCEEGHESIIKIPYEKYEEMMGVSLVCNDCMGRVKRKISVVGIIFKGSGFTVSGRV